MKQVLWRGRRTGHARRVCSPDVLALWNRVEDAIPTAVEIKSRHVQHQQRIAGPPGGGSPFNRGEAPQRNRHMNRLGDPARSAELAALRARFARIVPTAMPLKPFPRLSDAG